MRKRQVVNITGSANDGLEVVLESMWLADIVATPHNTYFGASAKLHIRNYGRRPRPLRFLHA